MQQRSRLKIPGLIALLALMIWGSQVAASDAGTLPLVRVSGEALQRIAPDLVDIQLQFEALEPDPEKAMQSLALKMSEPVAEWREVLGEERVRVTQVRIAPREEWIEGRSHVLGYVASSSVRLRDLAIDEAGQWLNRVSMAGPQRIDPLVYRRSDSDELRLSLLAAAAQDARLKAQALAEALELRLGPAWEVSESWGSAPVQSRSMAQMDGMVMSAMPAVELSPDELEFRARVEVAFTILR